MTRHTSPRSSPAPNVSRWRLPPASPTIPGIGLVETRVAEDVTVTLPGGGEPLTAHVLSLPESGEPQLNRLYLRQGRLIASGAADEVLVSEAFAAANQLHPGDSITRYFKRPTAPARAWWVLCCRRNMCSRPARVTQFRTTAGTASCGWAGVRWHPAFDMEGGFNDVVASIAPGANLPAVLAALDTLLEPYGGLVAYGRTDQPSHRFLADEIAQQGVMATTIPVVFLCVSVFLLHGMLGRLVGAQREQIAALKALGYGNRSIAWHYVKFALAVVGTGALLGILLGLWFGWMMVGELHQLLPLSAIGISSRTLGADPGHRRRAAGGRHRSHECGWIGGTARTG